VTAVSGAAPRGAADRPLLDRPAATTWVEDGLTVTDLHSTNGVLVGGSRIEPGMPAAVADGTDLLLGDLRIHVARSAPGAPEQG
jgi:predicted component of type VI protein secretion system